MRKAINEKAQPIITEILAQLSRSFVARCNEETTRNEMMIDLLDFTTRLIYNALGFQNVKYINQLDLNLNELAKREIYSDVKTDDLNSIHSKLAEISACIEGYKANVYIKSVCN